MKKIVSFEKNISFPSMIGEITSISLDHNLRFIDNCDIEGEFTISGTYKMTEASTIEDDFTYNIPAEIALAEKFELEDSEILIDDFHYEIINDDILRCNIDVLISGIEVIDEVRECDGDIGEDDEVEMLEDESSIDENIVEDKESDNNISSIFDNLKLTDDKYTTYSVYIYRKDDSIEKVLDRYNITMEKLEEYNDLNDLSIGTKLIIPSTNE